MVTSVPSGTTIFVIDTEQSSFNFVHDMCAYITGRVGEKGQGDEYAQLYEGETNKEPLPCVVEIPDDRGMMCPCSEWPTPGWFNNGAGGNFRVGRESEAIADYRKQILQERSNLIRQKETILSEINAGKVIQGWTREKLEQEIRRHKSEINEAQTAQRFPTYPAYLSVAIFFRPMPSELMTDFMKVRAFKFIDARKVVNITRKDTINITGFRLMKIQTIKHFTQLV